MLASAETREEVVEQLRRDTYFTSGVWDWDKVVVYPVSGLMLCSEVRGCGAGGGCLVVAGLGWVGLMGRIVQERDSEGTVKEWEGGGGRWSLVGVASAWLACNGLENWGLGTFLCTYVCLDHM